MSKKGQITWFMLIGIVLFLLFGLLYLLPKLNSTNTSVTTDQSVESYVTETLTLAAKKCLHNMGLQGGLYQPEVFMEIPKAHIEYAFYQRPRFLSSKELREQFQLCMKEAVPQCIENFAEFKRRGVFIEEKQFEPDIILAEENSPIFVHYELDVFKGKTQEHYDRFQIDPLPVRLSNIHNVTQTITEQRHQQDHPADIDLTYLGEQGANTTIWQEEDEQIYVVKDHKSSLNTEPYLFIFANAFSP